MALDAEVLGWLEGQLKSYLYQQLDLFPGWSLTEVYENREPRERFNRLQKQFQLEHILSDRQTKAVQYILEYGELTIQDFEKLCVETPRRSLQRDLKSLVEKGILITEGSTNQLTYKLAP